MAKVWAEFDAKRNEWAVNNAGRGDDFRQTIRGGAWTAVHRGTSSDCVVGVACTGTGKAWRAHYKVNKMASFSFNKYTERGASILSLEWVRRMQHFLDIWRAQGLSKYVYTAHDSASYQEGADFVAFMEALPATDARHQRGLVIRALAP